MLVSISDDSGLYLRPFPWAAGSAGSNGGRVVEVGLNHLSGLLGIITAGIII